MEASMVLSRIDWIAQARERRQWVLDWIEEFVARELFVPTVSRARDAVRLAFGKGISQGRLLNMVRAYRALGIPAEPPRAARLSPQRPYTACFVPVGTAKEVEAAEKRLMEVLARLIDQ
jgi:hypothetical protein